MVRMWPSRLTIFGVVPDDTRAWKPETAPHMMQMNTNGKTPPQGNVGPPLRKTGLTAGQGSAGLAVKTATMSRGMVAAMVNVPQDEPLTGMTQPAGSRQEPSETARSVPGGVRTSNASGRGKKGVSAW